MEKETVFQAVHESEKLVERTSALVRRLEELQQKTYNNLAESGAALRASKELLKRLDEKSPAEAVHEG